MVHTYSGRTDMAADIAWTTCGNGGALPAAGKRISLPRNTIHKRKKIAHNVPGSPNALK